MSCGIHNRPDEHNGPQEKARRPDYARQAHCRNGRKQEQRPFKAASLNELPQARQEQAQHPGQNWIDWSGSTATGQVPSARHVDGSSWTASNERLCSAWLGERIVAVRAGDELSVMSGTLGQPVEAMGAEHSGIIDSVQPKVKLCR